MSLSFNGTELQSITWNGDDVQVVTMDGVEVWSASTPTGICLVQTGGGAGTWARVDENGNAVSAKDFNKTYPWKDIKDDTVDEQAMVYIPKFYIKTGTFSSGTYSGKQYWLVSKTKNSGYRVHPAFVRNGSEIDGFYIGKYESYDAGSSKAGSAKGEKPWVTNNLSTAKSYCSNRGSGWHLQNIYEIGAINILLLIEIGTSDVQTAIGAGNTSGNILKNTGDTNAVYRGICEWWGNEAELVDGLQYSGSTYQIFSNTGDGTYVSVGTRPGSGWSTSMLSNSGDGFNAMDVFLPGATSSSYSDGTYSDYYYYGDRPSISLRSGYYKNSEGREGGAFKISYENTSMSGAIRLAKYA